MGQNGLQKLTPRQQKGLQALITEPSTRAAAKASGIGETTLWAWLADPFFAKAVNDTRARLFETAIANLQQSMNAAVLTLRAVLEDKEARPGEKVSAARAILEFSLRSKELIEFEQRLAALEDALQTGTRAA